LEEVERAKAAHTGRGSMATAKPIDNEAARLAALHKYAILDTEPEQAFADLVHLVHRQGGLSFVISETSADSTEEQVARWLPCEA